MECFTDSLSEERKCIVILLLILPILFGLMSGDLVLDIIGIVGIVIAVVVVVFFNGIDKDIISDRDKVYPKINDDIKKEFAKYETSSEPEKRKVINTVKELDTFRIRLRNIRKTRNHGFLFIFIELILLIAILVLLAAFPFSLLTNQYITTLPSISFISIAEILLFLPYSIYSDFGAMWKVSQVLIEHIDNKNEDLTTIVCKIFKTHRKKS